MREAYVRAYVVRDGWELVAGIEYRDGDDFDALLGQARYPIEKVELHGEAQAASWVEGYIRVFWPDRAFFIEIAQHPERGWIQVYDSKGFIKERCTCACAKR